MGGMVFFHSNYVYPKNNQGGYHGISIGKSSKTVDLPGCSMAMNLRGTFRDQIGTYAMI